MQHDSILLSTAYFAPAEYYSELLAHQTIHIEQHEFFLKQTFRNRCEILAANGKQTLSIPLQERKNKSLTKDIRIDYKTPWQLQHWRSISSAYNASPFFEFYQDDLFPLFERKFDFLLDLNQAAQEKILEIMGIKIKTLLTPHYDAEPESITDARNLFTPKIKSQKNFPPYIQVFENKYEFVPNLSILDALFNLGNECEYYLRSIY
ncbi:MAG: WbqC family protein [Bacteroidetes bacterium]|nr:WbqC family protein [Bacteroidota bacterium]